MKKAKTAGMLKTWYQRLTSYVSMVNFIMIFYLYIIESPLGFQWYHWLLLISVSILSILYIDIKYVFPTSQTYAWKKNPEFQELKQDKIIEERP